MHQQALHRLSVATAAVTFALLIVGGIVHGTGSSLACPDWPLCYGEVFPEMTGGVLYEHSHRLLASAVGLLTIGICVLALRGARHDRRLALLGPLALAMVVFQGVLGGLTVIYKLPTMISTAHLGLSMIFFATLLLIAWRTRPDTAPVSLPAPLRRLVTLTAVAIYLQILLGGLVRHTGGGMACLDGFPNCRGLWWDGLPPPAQLQMAHRFFAVLVSLLVLVAAARVFRAAAGRATVRALAIAAPLLLAAQVTLGILSVWSFLGLWQVTAHLGVGALLLANFWLLRLATRPAAVLRRAPVTRETPTLAAEASS